MIEEKSRGWLWAIPPLVIVSLVLGYLWMPQPPPEQPVGPTVKTSIGVSATSLLASLVYVAKAQGYFLEEGLEVEVKGYPTGKAALTGAFKKEVDMATVAGMPIVMNSFKRNDFSIFATILDSTQHVRTIARKDRGVENAQDLIGKKVGASIGTTSHYYMSEFLLVNGLQETDVDLVNLKPKQMVDAITKGDVDAVFAWEPNATHAERLLGPNAVHLTANVGYKVTFNMVAMNDFIAGNAKVIDGVVRALVKAENYVAGNREDSLRIVANYIGMEPEDIDVLWNRYGFRLSLPQFLLLSLENQARWAVKTGRTDKSAIPNYMDYLYFDALKEARPNAISIIY